MAASISCKFLQNCGRRLLQQLYPQNLRQGDPQSFLTSYHVKSFQKLLLPTQSLNITPCRYLSSVLLPTFTNNSGTLRTILTRETPQITVKRTKVRYSMQKGKPKTVHAVLSRFYRLDWGAWIRPRAGRRKALWKKSSDRKHRLRQHVFCTKSQSKLFDHMVTNYWKKPRHYVDDPYAPYQKRTNFNQVYNERPPFLP